MILTPPLEPSDWVRRWTHLVPPDASVLDVACGSGRHMKWCAAHGHPALGLDRDPAALRFASAFGDVLACDLETAAWPIPGQQFGAVVVTNYLWRPLLPTLADSLAPDGVLLYETFTQGNASVGRPANPDFLLRPGELLEACCNLRVVAYENGFLEAPQRYVQRIAAVRCSPETQDDSRFPLAPPA